MKVKCYEIGKKVETRNKVVGQKEFAYVVVIIIIIIFFIYFKKKSISLHQKPKNVGPNTHNLGKGATYFTLKNIEKKY